MSSMVLGIPARIGMATIDIAGRVGGVVILTTQIIRRFRPSQVDRYELVRNLYRMGVKSLPILVATAFFAGAIMVIQAEPIVMRYEAKNLVGWSATFTTFREICPLMIGLMFNGRVGANNTAELGTMVVTEQLDALRALAIDPITYLIVPRVISIILVMTLLCIVADFLAIIGAMGMAWAMLDLYPVQYFHNALEMIDAWDFWVGIIKAFFYGIMIALNSSYFGITTSGGAAGVGRAVNASVVAAASGVFVADYFSTFLLD